MFNSLRRFFRGSKNKKTAPAIPESDLDLAKIGVELFDNRVKINTSLEQTDDEYLKDSVKRYKEDMKKGVNMAKFLVVLDTKNRPEVKDRALQGGLKNFYIVNAATKKQATEMVMSTFAHKPGIVKQICHSFQVTNLNDVTKTVSDQHPVWSYIPFRANHMAPGQQRVPPTQQYVSGGSDEVIPLSDPSKIVTPPEMDHTPKLPSTQQMTMNEDMTANPMAAMMGMFAQMMQNPDMMKNMGAMMPPAQPAQPTGPPEPPFKKVNPADDPELQNRMRANLENQGARHVNHTGLGDAVVSVEHGGMDDIMDDAEAQARADIDTFKRLPAGSQEKAGTIRVENDVSVEDMESFRKTQRKTNFSED